MCLWVSQSSAELDRAWLMWACSYLASDTGLAEANGSKMASFTCLPGGWPSAGQWKWMDYVSLITREANLSFSNCHCAQHLSLKPYNSSEGGIPILWKKKLWLRKKKKKTWIKEPTQGHMAGKQQIQDSSPGLSDCKAYSSLLWKPLHSEEVKAVEMHRESLKRVGITCTHHCWSAMPC